MNRWNHQVRGVTAYMDAYDRGVARVCLSCPTGGGKTLIVFDIVQAVVSLRQKVAVFSSRKVLIDQLIADMVDARIPHGVRAAGHDHDLDAAVQICSVPTEVSRVLKRKTWEMHANGPGDVNIFDEGHLHTNGHVLTLRKLAIAGGARTLDITATPIGMGSVCDELLVLASNTELRECKAHLLIEHYAPDEPDRVPRRKVSKASQSMGTEGEDLSENQQRALMGSVTDDGKADKRMGVLYGRIWENFVRINHQRRPFICFGPGVNESLWIAQQFTARGVRTAHVDGEHVWLDGELHRKTDALWQEVLDESRAGRLLGLCCRFVLREGFNAPWLGHGIMATIFGSVASYIQAGGRLSRFWPGWETKTLQDHGGNFYLHGSLNIDRRWSLSDTASAIFHQRADRIREKVERPPVVCPKCGRVLTRHVCPCGHVLATFKLPRAVLTSDGSLEMVTADYFPAVRRSTAKDGWPVGRWKVEWKRSCTAKAYRTFRQAEANYCRENRGMYPSRDWPLMPLDTDDLYRRVLDVPVERLRGDPDLLAEMGHWQRKEQAKKLEKERGEAESLYRKAPPQAEAEGPAADGAGEEPQGREVG